MVKIQLLSRKRSYFRGVRKELHGRKMSKNTASSKFRKVNVEDYDPENFKDETVEGEEEGPNESEVQKYLSLGKPQDALEVILKNPPIGAKNQAVKDKAVQLAIRVLTTFKTADIDAAVKALDAKQLDILMKYIYRGFEFPTENSSASLLTWHEKVYAEGGVGCIVRVLTDRKRI